MGPTVTGILIMLLSTSTMNVAAVVQKKAVDRLPPLEGRPVLASVRSLASSGLWVTGLLMGVVAIVMNMVALGLADISVIQPLNGFGLVVLAVVSRLYLGERLTKLTVTGIALVIVGVAMIGATVAESRVFSCADELLGCFINGQSVVTFVLFGFMAVGLWAMARRPNRASGILYAVVAAFCNVIGLTFSKGFFGLITVAGPGLALSLPSEYLLLLLVLFFCTVSMMFQQLSFQKGRAVVVTPVFVSGQVVLPLALGTLVFGERPAWITALAVLSIVTGVLFLGLRNEVRPR